MAMMQATHFVGVKIRGARRADSKLNPALFHQIRP